MDEKTEDRTLPGEEQEAYSGDKLLEITRVMNVEITIVTRMTRRRYTEGAITETEAKELFAKFLPKEWGLETVEMINMNDRVQEVQE